MSFPKRKLPAALAWLACGLYRRATGRLRGFRPGHALNAPVVKRGGRGHLRDIDVPREADSTAQYERRP
jgi:hypothetical protein